MTLAVGNRRSVIPCAPSLAPREAKFVILDGSTAEGKDSKFSDYDVAVVKKGPLKQPGSVQDLFGMFRGRIFVAPG